MRNWVEKSFGLKVTLFLVTGGFLITFTYAYLDYLKEKVIHEDILATQARQLTETLALLVDENVRYEKYYELWDQLHEVYKNNHAANDKGNLFYIREIYVVNDDGELLGHTDTKTYKLKTIYVHPLLKKNPVPVSEKLILQSIWSADKQTLLQQAALIYGGDLVGFIVLDLDTSPLIDLKKTLFINYLSFQILATLVVILAAYLFARWVSSPLMSINSILNKIGTGDVKLPVLTERKDEYRNLGIAIEKTDQRIWHDQQNMIEQNKIIKESANHLTAILDTAADCIININSEGIIENVNTSVTQTFGYEESELIGKNVSILMPEKYRHNHCHHLQHLSNPAQSKNMGKTLVYEGLRKDGGEFPMELAIGYWKSNDEYHYTGVIRDITVRRQAEQELSQYQNNLEELVAERTRALELANKELESFSYSVSHDLRAPLRSIDGFSSLLIEDYENKIDSTGQDYLKRLRQNTKRMSELIDDLLALSQISRFELNKESINLSVLTHSIINVIKVNHPEKNAKWIVKDDVISNADEKMIRIVLENLFGNAWKYSSKKELPEIEFGERLIDGDKVYFVKDNGAGFDMKFANKLFGVFQRLHKIDEFEGTGVGLATVKRIIQRHGGKIWADAEVGNGATFYFTLGN